MRRNLLIIRAAISVRIFAMWQVQDTNSVVHWKHVKELMLVVNTEREFDCASCAGPAMRFGSDDMEVHHGHQASTAMPGPQAGSGSREPGSQDGDEHGLIIGQQHVTEEEEQEAAEQDEEQDEAEEEEQECEEEEDVHEQGEPASVAGQPCNMASPVPQPPDGATVRFACHLITCCPGTSLRWQAALHATGKWLAAAGERHGQVQHVMPAHPSRTAQLSMCGHAQVYVYGRPGKPAVCSGSNTIIPATLATTLRLGRPEEGGMQQRPLLLQRVVSSSAH